MNKKLIKFFSIPAIIGILVFIGLKIITSYAEGGVDSPENYNVMRELLEETEEKDSIIIGNIILKYPRTYQLKEQYGDEKLGEYILLKNSKDQLIISYDPKVNANGKSYSSVGHVLKRTEKEYSKHIVSNLNLEPKLSQPEYINIRKYDVKKQEIKINDKTIHIYVFETNEHFIRLISNSSSYLLHRIIDNIKTVKNGNSSDENFVKRYPENSVIELSIFKYLRGDKNKGDVIILYKNGEKTTLGMTREAYVKFLKTEPTSKFHAESLIMGMEKGWWGLSVDNSPQL